MEIDDTIVAVSSPPGPALRGIVRLSGPESIPFTREIFEAAGGCRLDAEQGNCRVAGFVVIEKSRLPAFACLFRSPKSYTRQDMVELHLLGSPSLLGIVVERLIALGARRAEAGEFTARAFLNGAMDLSQVHGVAGLIAARSDAQVRAAEQLLHGSLSQTAHAAREELADLLSLVEGAMDFADEPIEFISAQALRQRLAKVRASLQATVAAGMRSARWSRLPTVVLAGLPNAGKSSLLNRLTGLDRAICTPVAGTTRDPICAPLKLAQMECLLVDTAGVESTTEGLARLARDASAFQHRAADLILHVFDLSTCPTEEWSADSKAPIIPVANKCDLVPAAERATKLDDARRPYGAAACVVSAETGEGCEALKARIEAVLLSRDCDAREPGIALMAEHRDALDVAIDSIDRAISLAEASGTQLENADLVALELHGAAEELASLVGRDQTEELLGRIFARFCVGK